MISSKIYSLLSTLPQDGEAVLYQKLPEDAGETLEYALKKNLLTASQGLRDDSSLALTQEGIAAVEEYRQARELRTLLKKSAGDAKTAKWCSVVAAVLAAASLVVSVLSPAAVAGPAAQETVQLETQGEHRVEAQGQGVSVEDFDALWDFFQARQKQRLETPFDAGQIAEVLVENPQDAEALSEQEVDLLMQGHPRPAAITVEKAREDVDLMLRAFRSTYAAYYYFGEAAFEEAGQTILSQLPGSGSVDIAVFEELVSGAFAFLRDAHAGVFPQGQGLEYRPYENNIRQRYYYTGLYFTKTQAGSFLTRIDGEDWEFVSFTDGRVRMEPGLQPDGTVCYSPVLVCSEPELFPSEAVVKKGESQKNLALKWTAGQSYLDYYSGDPDYTLLEQNGVYYISERAFQSYDPQILEQFAAGGGVVRDAKLIVFDLRSNGGGNDMYAAQWIRNFTDREPQMSLLFAARGSKISQRIGNMEPLGTYRVFQSQGQVIPNEIPIVVLVDDRCASAGESMLNNLRGLDNVIVVGSNSGGFQLCGNVVGLTLPNSGMIVQFGTSLSFQYSPESVDFAGYEPDIWCDPRTSLDAVWNMLVKYGKITEDQVPDMGSAGPVQGGQGQPDFIPGLSLGFRGGAVPPEGGFGAPEIGPHFVDVLLDGRKITDYQLEVVNPDSCACEIQPDGSIRLTRTGVGTGPLIVTAGDQTATFVWFGGDEPPVPTSNCEMTLLYYGHTIYPCDGFGSPEPDATHVITVLLEGKPITGYQVENGNPDACTIEIDSDGLIQLTRVGPGSCEFTVRSGDNWATFRWYGGEE